jgi:hypothetical protein
MLGRCGYQGMQRQHVLFVGRGNAGQRRVICGRSMAAHVTHEELLDGIGGNALTLDTFASAFPSLAQLPLGGANRPVHAWGGPYGDSACSAL